MTDEARSVSISQDLILYRISRFNPYGVAQEILREDPNRMASMALASSCGDVERVNLLARELYAKAASQEIARCLEDSYISRLLSNKAADLWWDITGGDERNDPRHWRLTLTFEAVDEDPLAPVGVSGLAVDLTAGG